MRRRTTSLIASENGAAAVEMALVPPLLLTLMFGSFELGNYFMDNHVVAKAVRDGARYASRQGFSNMPCGGTATNETQIKTLVRTGSLTGVTPKLPGWTNPDTTIFVTITCNTGNSYSDKGIYSGMTGGAPVVTVTAAVPYNSLFGAVGFNATNLTINARSQAPVMGI